VAVPDARTGAETVTGTTTDRKSLQERFESSVPGRVVISLVLIATLITILTANLPASRLQDLLVSADHAYLYGAGLDQGWGVFAPEPRRETIDFTARVTFADGSQATWQVPKRNSVIGEYIDYRWLKWTEYVVSPAHTELSRPIALYVARKLATPQRRPVRVSLTNRWYQLDPPGDISDRPFFHDQTFFTTQITESDLRGQSS
jgi:hypothetical protein